MVYRDREGGKERVLRLGAYPTVSLKEARAAVNVYREWLADGIDPKAELERQRGEREHREREEKRRRQEEEALGTVANLFDSYVARMEAMGRRSAAEVRYSLNRDALPLLGRRLTLKTLAPTRLCPYSAGWWNAAPWCTQIGSGRICTQLLRSGSR